MSLLPDEAVQLELEFDSMGGGMVCFACGSCDSSMSLDDEVCLLEILHRFIAISQGGDCLTPTRLIILSKFPLEAPLFLHFTAQVSAACVIILTRLVALSCWAGFIAIRS